MRTIVFKETSLIVMARKLQIFGTKADAYSRKGDDIQFIERMRWIRKSCHLFRHLLSEKDVILIGMY